jgi:hypothetical protein
MNNKDGFVVTVEQEITKKQIAYLLESGMEGGMTAQWARIDEYITPKNPVSYCNIDNQIFPHIDYPLNEDGAVILKDLEDGDKKKYRLDLKSIQNGLQVMADKYPKHFADFASENYDAVTGDVFIQCCIFNKIVYG